MIAVPSSAQRCIDSFNGRILFMPSSYSRDTASFPAVGRSPWEPATPGLNLVTYYLLVLFSLTGLSTVLGRTVVLDARDVPADSSGEQLQCELASAGKPSLVVEQIVLDYLVAPGSNRVAAHGVRLLRRFEYNFKMAGVNVVMLHFISVAPDGTPSVDAAGRDILHLVEVYETTWRQWNTWTLHPATLVGLAAAAAATTGLLGARLPDTSP